MCRATLTCALAVAACAQPAGAQPDDASNTVTIKDSTYEIYPPEKLRARGFDVPDIPRDRNAAWVYIEAINAVVDLPADLSEAHDQALGGEWPEGEAGQRLAEWLQQNKPCLDAVRRATTMDEYYMPLFRGETDALINALLPPLANTRRVAKTMAVEATYLMSQGRGDDAVANCLALQRMGHQVADGQTLIEGLVGIAVSALAAKRLMYIAESGQVGSEVLKSAVAEMEERAESVPGFEQMVRAEQKFTASLVDDMLDSPGSFSGLGADLPGLFTLGSSSSGGWKRLATRLKRLYFPDRTMKKHFQEHYDTLVRATQHEDGTVGMTLDEAELFSRIPAWDGVSRMLLPSLARCHELTLRGRSNFVRTRLALAVAAYHADRGEPPPALSALVPEYIASIPADPMTGYDFEYQPAGGADQSPKRKRGVFATRHSGLEFVSQKNKAELLKKRRTPAILNPRASKWRRYVESFCGQHRLTDAQRASAQAVLRDLSARAAAYEQAHGARLQQLIDAEKTAELARHVGPLDKMFKELRHRLDALLTAKQRAEAKKAER